MTFILAFITSDFASAGRMTLKEFRLQKIAHVLSMLDREREMHLQAFLNRNVKAVDNSGKKYIYKKFTDFYDYEERKKEVLHGDELSELDLELMERARRIQEFEKGGINGI